MPDHCSDPGTPQLCVCVWGGVHHGRRRARPHEGTWLHNTTAPDLDLGQKFGDSWSQHRARRVREGDTVLSTQFAYEEGSL